MTCNPSLISRATAPSRLDPLHDRGGRGSPDLGALGRRPHRGARHAPPPLRLGSAETTRERPHDLLQGPRLAASLRGLPGRRRHRRGRTRLDLSSLRRATPGPPDSGAALGRLRHRVARLRRRRGHRRRARGQVPRRAALPGLGALRGQRARRGFGLGGLRQGRVLRARQLHGDRRRQPAGPTGADRARLGPRRLREARRRIRLPPDRGRRTRPGGDRHGPRARPGGPGGRPSSSPARSRARGYPRSRTRTAGTAWRFPPSSPPAPSPRSAVRARASSPRRLPHPGPRRSSRIRTPRSRSPATPSATGSRPARPGATRSSPSRPARRSSCSTPRSATRRTRSCSSPRRPSATSRRSSPSS